MSGYQPPSVARMVHYLDRGVCRAAVITAVTVPRGPREAADEVVSLTVFEPGGLRWAADVPHGFPEDEGRWHWPERVEMTVALDPLAAALRREAARHGNDVGED